MHPDVIEAIDQVDAMVFSGDTLIDPSVRRTFKEQVESWLREIQRWEEDEDIN